MTEKNIPANERLIFAMDVADCDQARTLADELGDSVAFYKLGLQLMMSGGYFELLEWMLAPTNRWQVEPGWCCRISSRPAESATNWHPIQVSIRQTVLWSSARSSMEAAPGEVT